MTIYRKGFKNESIMGLAYLWVVACACLVYRHKTPGGGGAAGTATSASGGNGGSGVVILSVPTANYSGTTTGAPTVTTSGSNTILTFTSSGSYTA